MTSPFEWVIWSDVPGLVQTLRWVVMLVWVFTAALLLKLYLTHKTGRMNAPASWGTVGAFLTIAWAQPVALTRGSSDLGLVPVFALITGISCLIGTLITMRMGLFKRTKR